MAALFAAAASASAPAAASSAVATVAGACVRRSESDGEKSGRRRAAFCSPRSRQLGRAYAQDTGAGRAGARAVPCPLPL
eukprot:6109698-Prymnesium_polylepis.1